MPMRIFTVTGTSPAARTAAAHDVARTARRCHGSAEPPPLRVTLGTGQPKFRSMWSAVRRGLVDQHPHRPADDGRVDAVELDGDASAARRASKRIIRSVFALRSTSARVVIISQT